MANLIDNPSLETGAVANPWIPDGWANVNLDPGDSQTSSTGGAMIHSGVECIQFNVGASAEGISQAITAAADSFVKVGLWSYGDGSAGFTIGGLNATQMLVQSSTTAFNVETPHTAFWSLTEAVFRCVAANPTIYLLADAGAAGNRYVDDVAVLADDDVTLTATAANQANSAEAAGLRIDGRDTCPQPIPAGYWAPVSGWMRWNWTPRHDAAQLMGFAESAAGATLARAVGNAANYIRVFATAANNIRLEFNDGGGVHLVNWACGADVVADTTYLMEVRYTPGDMWLMQDGVERARITTPLAFAVVPTNVYWGSRQAGDRQVDAVYGAP